MLPDIIFELVLPGFIKDEYQSNQQLTLINVLSNAISNARDKLKELPAAYEYLIDDICNSIQMISIINIEGRKIFDTNGNIIGSKFNDIPGNFSGMTILHPMVDVKFIYE